MKRIALKILMMLIAMDAFAIVDLGKIGSTKEIVEEDVREQMQRAIKNMKIDNVKEKIINSIEKQAIVKTKMPDCLASSTQIKKNIVKISRDYNDLGGDVLFAKGEERIENYPVKVSTCFVNSSNIKIAKQSLLGLLKKGKCDKILVANKDFRKLRDLFPNNKNFYPFNKDIAQAMKIECLPARTEAYQENITIDYLSIEGMIK